MLGTFASPAVSEHMLRLESAAAPAAINGALPGDGAEKARALDAGDLAAPDPSRLAKRRERALLGLLCLAAGDEELSWKGPEG